MITRKTTREILGESIHDLAKRKPMDKITVKEIAQNCGVTTATFYNHFRDKFDLIAWVFNYQLEEAFLGYADGTQSWTETIDYVISILHADSAFYRNALANTAGQNSFFFSTHFRSIELLTDIVRQKAGKNADPELLFFVEFYIRGTSITTTEWILGGCQVPEKQMAQRLYKAMPVALHPYLI